MSSNFLKNSFAFKIIILVFVFFLLVIPGKSNVYGGDAKYVILFVADGFGKNHLLATNNYCSNELTCDSTPSYQFDPGWTEHWVATYPSGGSYNSTLAWSDFNYVMSGAVTDSASAATALYTGFKTQNRRISVSADASSAFFSIGEKAKESSMSVGAISTVPVSHATPGAWFAHNSDRGNTFAIADEGLFGDPNTTGTSATHWRYDGGYGPTMPPADVVIGSSGADYISSQILVKLRDESGQLDKHTLVEKQTGFDGGSALINVANDINTIKLAGIFDRTYRNANGSGFDSENPTLADSTEAALKVLNRNPKGFVLMVEGGAIDWAAHANNMNQMIGEQIDFNNAVQTAIDWVDDPTNGSNWANTLVMVTGDHECGYLTAGPGVFPDQPLGDVTSVTLALEDLDYLSDGETPTGHRASWEDTNFDGIIDTGETVYWYWNSGSHTNSLIPLYARGTGSELISGYETGSDSVRGTYLDSTEVFSVMDNALLVQTCSETGAITIIPGQTIYGNPVDLTSLTAIYNANNLSYEVKQPTSCEVDINGTYIDAEDFTATISQGQAIFLEDNFESGYIGSGYLRSFGSNITPGSCPAVEEGKEYEVNFLTTGDYNVWIKGFALDKSNDSVFIGIDGNCVGAIRETPAGCTSPGTCDPYLNTWVWSNEIQEGSNIINISTPGLHKINVWIREAEHLLDGIYITQGSETPSDVSRGIQLDPTDCGVTLFSGDETQSQSVNTTGWSNGPKSLKVSGDDLICLTPIAEVTDSFTYDSSTTNSDTLAVSLNTPIASTNPTEIDTGIVMQRFQLDSDNAENGQIELSSISLVDDGTATSILDAKIYISSTSSASLPLDAVLIGNSGLWNGTLKTITLDGGTASDRTVLNGAPKYIYIVYDLAVGQAGNTITSTVSAVSVTAPDLGAGNIGSSNLLNIVACPQTGSITIDPGETLYGNPIDSTSIVTASNASNLVYTISADIGGYCNVDPEGTFIHAENYHSTLPPNGGANVFSLETSQSGFIGTGYLKSNGVTSTGSCPPINQGKSYQVNFTQTGSYTFWIRSYAANASSDSIFIGLDGNCVGALKEISFNQWTWTKTIQNGTNTINVTTLGVHSINVWVREPNHLIDGIYITQGSEIPNDVSHGLEIDPTSCPTELFSGTEAEAQSINTLTWVNGEKTLTVTGDDLTCTNQLPSAADTFTFDANHRPSSNISDPLDSAVLTESSPNPYTVIGTAFDANSINHVEISTDGGQTWQIATCPQCPASNPSWSYSWTLPANGSYILMSKAVDNAALEEIPGAGINVTIQTGIPSVTSTIPADSATAVGVDSPVTINWDRDVDCLTVTDTSVAISPTPATSWTKSACSGSQATFTPLGQGENILYSITVNTSVTDNFGNAMISDHVFSYTTGELTPPSSTITSPFNNQKLNTSSPDPYTIYGMATDNSAVSGVEIKIDTGAWTPTTCTGCGTGSADWEYSWNLPPGEDGTIPHTIEIRATDSSSNVQNPTTGITFYVDKISPSVSLTAPFNDEISVIANPGNSNLYVNIAWNENMDCDTINSSSVTISPLPATWARVSCFGNAATFNLDPLAQYTQYTISVSTAVTNDDTVPVPMSDAYNFSFTTNDTPTLDITEPNGTDDTVKANDLYNIVYSLIDADDLTTAAFHYNINPEINGATLIADCNQAPEGPPGTTCQWDTSGVAAGTYYIIGATSSATDPAGSQTAVSPGQITINPSNVQPTLSISQPDGTDDTIVIGDNFNINYTLNDPDNVETVSFYYETDGNMADGTLINNTANPPADCSSTEPEGSTVSCAWNTAGVPAGSYYIYGVTNDGETGSIDVKAVSPGVITINSTNTAPFISFTQPDGQPLLVTQAPFDIVYTLLDIDDLVTADLYYDNDQDPFNGKFNIPECLSVPEGNDITCTWAAPPEGVFYIGAVAYGDRAPGFDANVSANTITVDGTPPSVNSTYPADGAISIIPNTNVTITWDENIDCTTVNTTNITSNSPGWTFSSCIDDQAVFTATGQSEDVTYNVNVTTAVKDMAGNPMAGNFPFSYSTGDAGPPVVLSTDPADSATGISRDSDVTITWDQDVDCATVNASTITSTSPGWTFFSCSLNQAVFTTSNQDDASTYSVTVSTAVQDTDGNPMVSEKVFSYETNIPPALSITKPDGTEDLFTQGNLYDVTYTLEDPDDVVDVTFYYDTVGSGYNGTLIGTCNPASAGEGVDQTCQWDTIGMSGSYYIYGMTTDGRTKGNCSSLTWSGAGIDNLASNGDNWTGGIEPQTGDTVIFDATSINDSDWDLNVSLSSLSLNSGYSGVLTVNSPISIYGDFMVFDGSVVLNDIITVENGISSCDSQIRVYSSGPITIGTAGITVTPTSGITTTESGGSANFTVVLDTMPGADVTIGLTSDNITEGNVSPSILTFTPGNWNIAQSVTVTGVDDVIIDGPIGYNVQTAVAVSTDLNYNGINAADVSLTNNDNDAAGLTVSAISGDTTESGGTATFTVVLNTQPTANVSINSISSDNNAEGTVSPNSLSFTDQNWNVPQQVTITGVDDFVDDDNQVYTIITSNATSSDSNYSGMGVLDVSVTNIDDDTFGISVSPTSGLFTSEAGGIANFSIVLDSKPTANVSIGLSSSNINEGTIVLSNVTFTDLNWNSPQQVTVTGADDDIVDGSIAYSIITATATSGDTLYNVINPDDVSLTNNDNDAVGVTITESAPSTDIVEAGATDTYDVVLTSQPSGPVTITITPDGQSTVGGNLTFTTGNWNVVQTVTVSAIDDAIVEGVHTSTISHSANGGGYDGVTINDVVANVTDNDSGSVTVTESGGTNIEEGGATDTYDVVLDLEPSATVIITVTSDAQSSVDKPSLTFTTANWNTAQTVMVTTMDDAVVEGPHTSTINHSASGGGYDSVIINDVVANVTDNDSGSVTITESGGTNIEEGGATDTYDVVLTTEPSATVIITVTSDAQSNVDKPSLTFTTANWNTSQTVMVTAVDDAVVEGVHLSTISHSASGGGYDSVTINDVVTNVTDNDSGSVTITESGGTNIEEGGATDTYDVVLDLEPSATVIITVTSDAQSSVDKPSLTFTTANWNTAQTVMVTAMDDAVVEGPHTSTINHSASGGGYDSVIINDVVANVTDNDSGSVTITESGGTNIEEGGATDTYDVVLDLEPSATVIITVTTDAQSSVDKPSLTFTTANWNISQTVMVTAVDDAVVEGPHTSTINHSASGGGYDSVIINDVVANVTDNDIAGFTVSQISNWTAEDGTTGTFTVVLNTIPSASVNIDLSSSDVTEGTVLPSNMTFTSGNWNIAQTATVTGEDDFIIDPDTGYTIITDPATSTDTDYDGVNPADVSLANIDNDTFGFTVSQISNWTAEDGTTGTFTVVLNTIPSASVTIDLSSSDVTEGTVLPANMIFTSGNWNIAQTATVTGEDDFIIDPDTVYTIITDPATSTDTDYNGINPSDVSVTNIDNDSAGVTITEIGTTDIGEDGTTDFYTVKLTSQPTDPVTVTITPDGQSTVSATPPLPLVFNDTNWNVEQTVMVTAVDDTVIEVPHTSTITHSASGGGYDSVTINDVVANVTDNDSGSVTITESGGTNIEEGGITDTYDVVLDLEPSATVIITVTPDLQSSVDKPSLTFTTANWNTSQTVLVTAVDDAVVEGPHTSTINHSASGGGYDSVIINDVVANVTDNDSGSVTITELGSTNIEEGGTTDTYDVVLDLEPSATVIITVTPDLQSSVDKLSLTFTIANWNTSQTVLVTAVDDAVVEGPHTSTINHSASGGGYDSVTINDVVANVTDNDSAGVTITEVGTTDIGEDGTTDSYTVTLTSQPTDPVTITITPDGQSTVSATPPLPLVFNNTNWNVEQTVTVSAVNDLVVEGLHTSTISHSAASVDVNYDSLGIAEVTANITDNDSAGFTVSQISNWTAEDGTTGTFTVVLNTIPSASVTIDLSSSDVTEGTVLPANMTFTSGNWNIAQTATVTGEDDFIIDPDTGYTIITAPATSTDTDYNGVNPADVSIANIDNDTIGVTVSQISNWTAEDGTTGTFTVVLNTIPSASVTIDLSSSDVTEGTVLPSNMTFTSGNWNIAQTATVTGEDDFIVDPDTGYTIITDPATSTDTDYNGLNPADVSIANIDNDTIGFTVSQISNSTAEDGSTGTFTVVLNTIPSASVTIDLSSSDVTEGTVLPANMIFTSGNWNIAQTATVTGEDDFIVDPDTGYTIITDPATSTDTDYNGANPADVSVANIDNDTIGFTVSQISNWTAEDGSTGTFTVVLNTIPSASVTIDLSSSDVTEGTVLPSNMTFTSGNWNIAQTATVTGEDDFIVDPDTGYTIITDPATSTDTDYNGANPADVSVANIDNDTIGFTVSQISNWTAEDGTTGTFTVVLNTIPSASVTIDLSSSDVTEGTVLPANMIFTSGNWNVAQTATVTGEDDFIVDPDTVYTIITDPATSTDTDYNGVNPADVSVTNIDDEPAP